MAVRCLFYLPHLDPPCEVIRTLGIGPAVVNLFAATRWQLCHESTFIDCPMFDYLEKTEDVDEEGVFTQPGSEP